MTNYLRLSEGLYKSKLIPVTDDIWNHIDSNDKDYYISIYQYNEDQYKQFKKTHSVAGIRDVTTQKLLFDFDNQSNPEDSRQDAITLVSRLIKEGFKQDNIQIYFSGSKGFGVEVLTDKSLTPDEFKNITRSLAGDLKTFDAVVSDPARVVRVLGTKHPKSGLYKFPLSVEQLTEFDVAIIKEKASSVDNIDPDVMNGWIQVELPENVYNLRIKKEEKKTVQVEIHDLDMSLKPKWLLESKYALQQGYFGSGERNTAFMILASTYKNQGFPKEITYRILKGVAELQSERNNVERYSDKELWNNVVNVVYKPDWKGGMYSYENTPLLQEVTKRLGLNPPKIEDNPSVPLSNISDIFRKFAINIDKNTIKLGIDAIDNDVKVTTSMLVGLVAPPGAGKTSLSLDIMNTTSRLGIKTMFFSMDMGAPLVFQRLIQKHTGLHSKKIFEMYKNSDTSLPELENRVLKEYENVSFCFRSGLTVEEIRDIVVKQQEDTGEKIKLVVVDYLECVSSQFSDATASGQYVVQKLKDMANDLECTVLLLLQPQKLAGDPSDEITSYIRIKGSSAIQQACSIIFSMWRPGFSPKNPENDRFVSIAVLKNRMGSLAHYDFSWNGLTGEICEMDECEKEELDELRARKEAEKNASDI